MICLLTCLRSRTQISTVKPMRRMPASTRMGPRMTRGPSQLTSAESSLQAAPAPAPAASSTTAVRERQQIMCLSDRRFRSAFRARLQTPVNSKHKQLKHNQDQNNIVSQCLASHLSILRSGASSSRVGTRTTGSI